MNSVHVAQSFADYYDGETAMRQRVGLRFGNGDYGPVLEIELPDGEHMMLWPAHRVRTLPDQAGAELLVVGLDTASDERLVATSPEAIEMILANCPNVDKPIPQPSIWRRTIMVSVVSALLIVGMIFLLLPGMASVLAGRLSPEVEETLGAEITESIRAFPVCNDRRGMAAYRALSDRVSAGVDLPYDLKIAVLDDSSSPTLNAYATPGGYITFFNTLIQAAETPEEIAAVFAHELAHVVNKDPVRGVLESATASILIGLLSGDVTGGGGLVGQYVTSSYSRGAEVAADEFAHSQLTAVNLPPEALATMFERMLAEYGDVDGLTAHFTSHPQLADRIAAAQRQRAQAFRPVLTDQQWQDLRNICSSHAPEPNPEVPFEDFLQSLDN